MCFREARVALPPDRNLGGKRAFQSIKSAPTGRKEKAITSLAPLFPVKHGVSQLMM